MNNTIDYNGSTTGYLDESNSSKDIASTAVSDILLFLLVFGMAATVDIKSMRQQLRNVKALLCGLFLQFCILPFFGYATIKMFNINQVSGITLLVIVSSPGGSYSNWWCSLFNAELALSIAMTTVSTTLSIAFLPFNLYVYSLAAYGKSAVVQSLNFISLFISILIVISAVVLGILCSAKVKNPHFRKGAYIGGNISGILLIVFSVMIGFIGGEDGEEPASTYHHPEYEDPTMYWSTALPCVLGLLTANILTSCLKLYKPERVTCSVECCYQNTGIATAVAISMFQGKELSEAVKVPLWYGVVEAGLLGIYLLIAWKIGWTKAPKNENICVVISKSYEISEISPKEIDGALERQKDDDKIVLKNQMVDKLNEASYDDNGETNTAEHVPIESAGTYADEEIELSFIDDPDVDDNHRKNVKDSILMSPMSKC